MPSLPTFPLILGRKPLLETGLGNHSLEKENRGPENVVAGLADTMLSKVGIIPRNLHISPWSPSVY